MSMSLNEPGISVPPARSSWLSLSQPERLYAAIITYANRLRVRVGWIHGVNRAT